MVVLACSNNAYRGLGKEAKEKQAQEIVMLQDLCRGCDLLSGSEKIHPARLHGVGITLASNAQELTPGILTP